MAYSVNIIVLLFNLINHVRKEWCLPFTQPPHEPGWEFVSGSAEEITELGEKLRRSKKTEDQHLAALVRYFPFKVKDACQ